MLIKSLLALTALFVSDVANAEWHKATSKHFVVYADDTKANIREFTERLERFDKGLRVWHAAKEDVRGPSARVTIFVLSDVAAIERLSGRSSVAGFYKADAGASVAFTPRSGSGDLSSRAILFHEYTHHWMLSNWTDAALPPWFIEGFAELHATALFRGNSIIFGAVPTYRRYTIGQMNLMPMSRMLRFDLGRLSRDETDALYSHGWALTHYLTFDPERRKLLADYIGMLNNGKSPSPAALSLEGGNLDLKLNSYVRRSTLPSAAFGFDQLPIGAVDVRALTPAEAAIMPAVILSSRGVSKENAAQAAVLARKLAAPFPNDPTVQNELAEAEYDLCSSEDDAGAGCFARSEAASDRALAADRNSMHALLYKGLAQVAVLKQAKVTEPARWAAARRWFVTANKADVEAPQPLIAFYNSFAAASVPATANAQSGLLYAYALAPYDSEVRMQAAAVYIRQGKIDDARIAIRPLAYNVDGGGAVTQAQSILKALDAGDAARAMAELDKSKTPGEDGKSAKNGK